MAASNPKKPSDRTWGKSLDDAPAEGAAKPADAAAEQPTPAKPSGARPQAPAPPTSAGRPQGPALIVLGRHSGTPPIALTRPAIIIGSRSNARIHLVSSKISRAHALLVQDSGITYIRDLASRTGVQINDEPVREALLHDGDIIGIGSFQFRFVAGPNALSDDQEPPVAPAVLVSAQGGPALPIEQRVTLIGRRASSDVPLLEESASIAHAALFRINGRHAVRDLGSRTGTYVNGISTRQHELRPGDVIRIGETELRYETQPQVDVAEAEARIAELAPPVPAPRTLTPAELEPSRQPPDEFAPAEFEPQPEHELEQPLAPIGEPPAARPIVEPAVESPPAPTDSPEIELAPSAEAPTSDAELATLRFADEIASAPLAPEVPPAGLEAPMEVAESPAIASAAPEIEAATPQVEEPRADRAQAIEEPPPLELAPAAAAPAEPLDLEPSVEPLGAQPFEPPALELIEPQRVPVSKTRERPVPIATQLAETIAPTEPTPESAMSLAELAREESAKESLEPIDQAPTKPQAGAAAPPADVASLSDTQFNRAVGEFAGSGLGDLVTEPPTAQPPADEPPAKFAAKPAAFIPPPLPPPISRPSTSTTPSIAPGSLGGFSSRQAGPGFSPAPPGAGPAGVPPIRMPSITPPLVAPAAIAPLPGTPPIPVPPGVMPSRSVPSPIGHQVIAPKGLAALAEGMRAVQGRRLDETIPPFTFDQSALAPRPRTPRRQVVPLFGQTLAAPPGKATEPPPEVVKRAATDVDARAFAGTLKPGKPSPQALTPMDLVVAEPPAAHQAPEAPETPEAPAPPTAPPQEAAAEESGEEHAAAHEADLGIADEPDGDKHEKVEREGIEHDGLEHDAAEHDGLEHDGDEVAQEAAASAAAEALGLDLLDEPEPLTPDAEAEAEVQGADQLAPDFPTPIRARRAAVLPIPLPMPAAAAPEVVEEPEPPVDLVRLHRKRLRRAWLCLGLAPVLGAVWAMGGWVVGPVHTAVEARVQFAGLDKQSRHDRGEFQKGQLQRLGDVSARRAALEKLQSQGGTTPVSPGFLDDPTQYDNVARSAAFSTEQPNLLVMRHDGSDAVGDRARLKAMTLAMYDANASLRDQAAGSAQKVQRLTDDIAQATQRLADLKNQIDALQPAVGARPAAADIAAVQTQLAALQQAYETARANRMAIEADLKARSAAAESPSDDPTTAPAAAAVAVASAAPTTAPTAAATTTPADTADAQLLGLQQELTQLDRQSDAARQQRQAQQDKSRAALDAAMAQFEQRVDSAKQMAPASPALSAYVATAQRVLATARTTVDDFVHQEEQTYAALSDLRLRLNDKMQQRQAQLWASDKKLTDLNDQLEIAKRQYNAALAGGLTKEAQDYKAQIDLTQSEIQAREELLPQDPVYADVVAQLQQLIETRRQNLQDDRAAAEKALASVQDQLQQSQPSDQSISPEQKALADDLQKGLAQVGDARRHYAEASASAESDDATHKLADDRQQLIASIATRKLALAAIAQQELRTRNRQEEEAHLADLRQQRDHLVKAESDALAAFNNQDHQLASLKQSDADGRDAANRLADALAERTRVQAGLDQDNRDIGPAADEANLAIVQMPINEGSDLGVASRTDMRPLFAMVGGGGAALLMLAMAGFNLLGAMRGLHVAEKQSVRAAVEPLSEVDYVDEAPEPVEPAAPAPDADGERRTPLAGSFHPLDESDLLSENDAEPPLAATAVEPEIPAAPPAAERPPAIAVDLRHADQASLAEHDLESHDEFEGLILDSTAESLDAPPRLAEAPPVNGLADDEAAFLEELLSTSEPPDVPAKSTNGEAVSPDDLEHHTRRAV
jgi:pSer/pThr/pTyr-binding forkhead associated (FHA) protein